LLLTGGPLPNAGSAASLHVQLFRTRSEMTLPLAVDGMGWRRASRRGVDCNVKAEIGWGSPGFKNGDRSGIIFAI
jgi:hypothetical protein